MAFRIRKRLIIALAVVLALPLLAPVLVPAGWRLVSDPQLDFHGWRATVPQGWFVMQRQPNIVLARIPWLYPLRRDFSHILLVENPLGSMLGEAAYPRWKQLTVDRERETGERLQLKEERAVRLAGQDGWCLLFGAADDPAQPAAVRVECFHPGAPVAPSFAGPPAHLGDFFSLLEQITAAAPQP